MRNWTLLSGRLTCFETIYVSLKNIFVDEEEDANNNDKHNKEYYENFLKFLTKLGISRYNKQKLNTCRQQLIDSNKKKQSFKYSILEDIQDSSPNLALAKICNEKELNRQQQKSNSHSQGDSPQLQSLNINPVRQQKLEMGKEYLKKSGFSSDFGKPNDYPLTYNNEDGGGIIAKCFVESFTEIKDPIPPKEFLMRSYNSNTEENNIGQQSHNKTKSNDLLHYHNNQKHKAKKPSLEDQYLQYTQSYEEIGKANQDKMKRSKTLNLSNQSPEKLNNNDNDGNMIIGQESKSSKNKNVIIENLYFSDSKSNSGTPGSNHPSHPYFEDENHLYNFLDFKEIFCFEDALPIRSTAFSPNGDFFAVGSNSGVMRIFSLGDILKGFKHPSERGQTQTSNIDKGKRNSEEHMRLELKNFCEKPIYSQEWSENGKFIATGGMDKYVKILPIDVDNDDFVHHKHDDSIILKGHEGTIRTVYIFLIKNNSYV